MGKLRWAAIPRSGYLYQIVKPWRTGWLSHDTPQAPITRTPHLFNDFAADPEYDPVYIRELIHQHVPRRQRDTGEPSWEGSWGSICGILTRMLLKQTTTAMAAGLLDIQHVALSGRKTTTLAARLIKDLHKTEGCLALLDVREVFLSFPGTMITNIIKEARVPDPITGMIPEIYSHTSVMLHLDGRDLPMHPKRGMM